MFPLHLTLPLPCRTNERNRHTKGGRSYTPPEAREKLNATIEEVKAAVEEHGVLSCGLVVDAVFYFETRGADHDSREKATWDALELGGLLLDDQQIVGGQRYAYLDPKEPRVELVINRCDDPELLDRWNSKIARAARKSAEALEGELSIWAAQVREKRRQAEIKKWERRKARARAKKAVRRTDPQLHLRRGA